MRWGHDFTSLAGFLVAAVCAAALLAYAGSVLWAGIRQGRAARVLRRAGPPREARELRRDRAPHLEVRAAHRRHARGVRRAGAPAVRERDADRSGDEPRCGHRARLLEEHVRARHRTEPYRAREGRGGAAHSRPARRALRRGRVRRRADELSADERRRGDRAVLPPARPERHARRRHGDGARARGALGRSSRATRSRRTTCA